MVYTVLITTSGIGERLGDITKYTNKALVKIGDKYAICYIIDSYDNDTEFIITLGYFGNYVKQFLLLAYPDKNFKFVEIDIFVGKGSSLGYSLLKTINYLQKPFIFHCCDSIILNKLVIDNTTNKNILYVYPCENSNNYTNIKGKNNIVSEINLKKHSEYDYIYTGIAYIHDFHSFWKYLQTNYDNNMYDTSLSDVNSIQLMIKNNLLFNYNILETWYDTGNIESYAQIQNIFKPKYNVIEKHYESLCFLNDRVIKFINDTMINKKRAIRGEYLYPLTPKILGVSDNFISMELIVGEILSESYEYGIIYKLLNWAIENLWNIKTINNDFINCCNKFYITKTIDRLHQMELLNNEKHIINGLKCNNVIKIIQDLPVNLLSTNEFTKFHGDFILDNIIKTENSFMIIDWRHEFDDQLYYGDIYYDLAKLRHNIFFNHSNILNGLFTIEHINNEVIVDLKCNYFLIQQLIDFDKFVSDNNYDINKIKIITSLIWLNMAPLYKGQLSEFLFYFGKYNLFILDHHHPLI